MNFNIEQAIGFNLHIAASVMKQSLKAMLKENQIELTTEEMVLLLLVNEDGVEQSDLQQKIHKDKTNVTRLLDRLEKKALIMRQMSQTSRRQQIISLTDEGGQTQKQLVQLIQQFSKQAAKDISPEAYQLVTKSLQKFIQNLTGF
ncbi:MAG: MarR family transcriptional regulator [Chloroflexota bacterium]